MVFELSCLVVWWFCGLKTVVFLSKKRWKSEFVVLRKEDLQKCGVCHISKGVR